jgi:hypothetical protein
MWSLLKTKVDLSFLVNPFYLYCISFAMAIFLYFLGWSNIYPALSIGLLSFFTVTFLIFIYIGISFSKKRIRLNNQCHSNPKIDTYIFIFIIVLGLINVLYMGYLPFLDRTHNYREFGMPIIDVIFNTLSIFFSISFFYSFLKDKKKKYLVFIFTILIFQILLFRRSTLVWIITSSTFLFLIYKKKLRIIIIICALISIPVLSFCFGLYGNTRSNISKSFIINNLKPSDRFKKNGIDTNHYMTYLYLSSPLANLQENIDKCDQFAGKRDFKRFIYYCVLPESLTLRIEKPFNLTPPNCYLITPELIAGSVFMVCCYTLGWGGMILMFLFLTAFILLCLFIIRKWDTFNIVTFSILSTTVSLLIFSNFLNRLDVLFMLFVYPVLFHYIYKNDKSRVISETQAL